MGKGSGNFITFLAGAATGALLGVLLAPDTGENTRKKLSFQLKSYQDKLKAYLEGLEKEESHAPDSNAKTEGKKVVSDAKLKAEKLLGDVESLIGEIQKRK